MPEPARDPDRATLGLNITVMTTNVNFVPTAICFESNGLHPHLFTSDTIVETTPLTVLTVLTVLTALTTLTQFGLEIG